MSDSGATVTVKVTQTGPKQTVTMEGMPAGAEILVQGLEGTGSGKMLLNPNSLALFGDLGIVTKIEMQVSAEGQTQLMKTETDVKLSITPGKR
jgi:hypothetical protein